MMRRMTDTANLSIVRAADTPALLELTIGEIFDAAVLCWPEREALVSVHQDIRWTYAELGRRVDLVARALLGLGLEPGDRVGIWSPNCAEWTVAQFATAKAGLILVNINPAYRTEEVAFTLNKVGVKALITAAQFKSSDYCAMLEALAPEIPASRPMQLRAERLPHLRTLIAIGGDARPGTLAFEALTRCRAPRCRRRSPTATRSTSSSPAARRACPKAPRSPIATSSTTRWPWAPAWACARPTVSAFRCRSITASAW